MIPCRVVVAGPDRGVTLDTGIAGARDDEGTAIRTQTMEALERRARHQGSVLVLVLEVGSRVAIALELNDVGYRLTTERCRLVHLVPHTAHADIDQRMMLLFPPVPVPPAGEIGPPTWT